MILSNYFGWQHFQMFRLHKPGKQPLLLISSNFTPPNQQSSCLNKGAFLGVPGTKLQKFQQQQVAAKRTGSNSSNEDVTVREVVFLLGEEEELSHQAGCIARFLWFSLAVGMIFQSCRRNGTVVVKTDFASNSCGGLMG